MTNFTEMEWTAKWDWENYAAFGPKAIESPKKLQFAESMVLGDAGSFNLSGGNSANFPSAKSSVSDSSNGNNQPHSFRFMTFEDTSGTFGNKMELSRSSTPSFEASVGFVEPLIGLKLGKRTYFENKGSFGALTVIPTPSTAVTHKRMKSLVALSRCQVDGCNVDLSMAKDYHRKHRVCDIHSKSPKVVIGGVERRFCQQCSRFHGLAEFDDRKRSCRRRLVDHNARRRKPPQQETIQFNSSNLLSRFSGSGGREQQMSFQFIDSNNYTWSNSKFTLTKSNGDDGFTDECLNMHGGYKLPDLINFQDPSKSSSPEVLNPGSKGSSSLLIPSYLDAAPAYRRALSLLSNNSWSSPIGPGPIQAIHPLPENYITTQPMMMNAVPEGVPLSYPDFWLTGQHSTTHSRAQPSSISNCQEIQLFKMPYEAEFYANVLN